MTRGAERNQADALRRIRDRGALAWCEGRGRAGGAVSRLFERMAAAKLCTRAPHNITPAGRDWLNKYEAEHPAER